MSVLNEIGYYLNRRDEQPNEELARRLAEVEDSEGISGIARNLWNRNANVQADCIKVLYEVGYLKPELIAGYAVDFLRLLRQRNNRLVWGGMIALSTIAPLRADELYEHLDEIQRAIDNGSVITVDAGVRALARIAAANPSYNAAIFPYLLDHLRTCRPQDVPQHAESALVAATPANAAAFIAVLQKRLDDLSPPRLKRVQRVLRQASALAGG